jgi:hypothetical protein
MRTNSGSSRPRSPASLTATKQVPSPWPIGCPMAMSMAKPSVAMTSASGTSSGPCRGLSSRVRARSCPDSDNHLQDP